jgi:hypothetical protein
VKKALALRSADPEQPEARAAAAGAADREVASAREMGRNQAEEVKWKSAAATGHNRALAARMVKRERWRPEAAPPN